MVDLLVDRVVLLFLFIIVGVDVFGLWNIVVCRIWGGLVYLKRWVVFFSCFIFRVIYIEVIEELSSLVFINVFIWFIFIWGVVKEFWLDCGMNFVGVLDYINVDVIYVEFRLVKKFLFINGVKWIFNFFYVLYMVGLWERMIGIVRKIFDFFLFNIKIKEFIYEVLCIFMCEVIVIMNFRLICFIFIDFEDLVIISLLMLLI